MKKFLFSTICSALVLFAANAFAYQQVFFGEDEGVGESTALGVWNNAQAAEANFLSHLTGTGTEDFESYSDGTSAPLAISFPGAGTATLTGGGEINYVSAGSTNNYGRYGTSGDYYWDADSDDFIINFDTPVAAFGFYGIDIGDFSGQLSIFAGATEYAVPHTLGITGGSVLFWGLIDTDNPFTSITFSNLGGGSYADAFGFDDMTIGSVEQVSEDTIGSVPEPSTFVLLAAGLLGLVGIGRKRILG
ncbi:PEP-CTERM sorting domain-containing protein [Pseudodesulfovibrio cashew]|uniref:PEP-CTERM sorting domain-containing protein n=1 Tax=Pseudodesulfovibrio cashew TaxID=2678688 RepID=A0A6I6JFT4_9BACT|nr:PEP-CTERM sorting domain-containing protein [Pseudodesulfovibrio cashew]QGY41031.1 PEP-CTERM sorting domain-containing protein [Pseudodesulfovibrio cashew]